MPTANFGDVDLFYEITGEGPPLLFIHGLGSSSQDWEYQVAPFSKSYQVITFDVRGHGRSSKSPGPYSIPQFAEDTAQLLGRLQIDRAHVVGISMGGMIAFQLAADHRDLVERLVIVNSGPAFEVKSFKERLQLWQRFAIVRLLGMRRMGQLLSGRLFPKDEHAALRSEFVERWAANDPRAYRDSMRAIASWGRGVSDQLPEITTPTLSLNADNDYTPVDAKQAYIDKMPNAKLVVIEDSRHALPVEKPDAFNEALAAFLDEEAA